MPTQPDTDPTDAELANLMGEKLARRIARATFEALVADGDIDPRGKTAEQLRAEVDALVTKRNYEWQPVTDWTGDLLRIARDYATKGSYEPALAFFGTWIEHTLNYFAVILGRRRKVPEKVQMALIRHTGTAEKFVWMHLVMLQKAPPEGDIAKLRTLLEHRNYFLHYKWRAEGEGRDAVLERAVADAEKLVKKLRSFGNKNFYHGERAKVLKVFGAMRR